MRAGGAPAPAGQRQDLAQHRRRFLPAADLVGHLNVKLGRDAHGHAAPCVDVLVVHDGAEPGAQVGPCLEPIGIAQRLERGVLDQVARRLGIVREAIGEAPQPRQLGGDHGPEGRGRAHADLRPGANSGVAIGAHPLLSVLIA